MERTLEAADRLASIAWAAPLLKRTHGIVEHLRKAVEDRSAYRAKPLTPGEMSFLFELRFARALVEAGLDAQYEYCADVGATTVDFRVALDPPWLVELVSLHESDAFKAASWKSGPLQGFILQSDAADPRQSEEGEMLKAQERIAAKAFDRAPVKFPEPDGSIRLIMVDARGYLGDGHGDGIDWSQIAYGPHGVDDPALVRYWTDSNAGTRAPIRGLFEPSCPLRGAETLSARVHVLGFVCEESFASGEIKARALYRCNPRLFSNEQSAQATMAAWPLRRDFAGMAHEDLHR